MSNPPLATKVILNWITARLQGDSVLAPLPIETSQAYEGVTFPYILITVPDPGRPYYPLGTHAVQRNGVYLVRGVQQRRGLTSQLMDIAERIIARLHGQRDDTTGVISCVLRSEYQLNYPSNETTYTDLGGLFDISITGGA